MRKYVMAALLAPSLVWAGATEDLLSRLQKLDSLKGGFEQMVLDKGGTHVQQAEGSFQVARGNRFYWSTISPFSQLAVSDGQTVWVYDEDLEQVVVRPLSNDLGQTPALLFSGKPADVAAAFNIAEQDRSGSEITYRLTPKGNDPLFDQLDVSFQGDEPLSMRLEDALGQKTIIDFHDLTINKGIDAALFQFQPPEGTDIIEQ